jgi:hypothetical protein
MTEGQYQEKFIAEGYKRFPNHVFVPFLDLKYSIGKYNKGRDFGMPDTILDVVEFDDSGNFHLWEMKKIESPEVWNGKFFGQLMLYNFLFNTEPWNELLGRFAMRNNSTNNGIKGDIGKILGHLSTYGKGEVAKPKDKNAKFKTWNLVVCGGNGYEIAAGVNPIAWSFWIIAEEYFKKSIPEFHFHQFYKDANDWNLITLPHADIDSGEGLTEYSLNKWKELENENN